MNAPETPEKTGEAVRSTELFSGIVQTLRWMSKIADVEKPCTEWKPCDWHAAGAAFAFKCAASFVEARLKELPKNDKL